jgi:hypothetical protein
MPSRAWPRLAMPGVCRTGEKEKYQSPSAAELPRKTERSRIPPVLSRKIFHAGINDQFCNVIKTHEHAGEFKEP